MVKVTGTRSGVVMNNVTSSFGIGATYGRKVTKKSLPPWSSPAYGRKKEAELTLCTTKINMYQHIEEVKKFQEYPTVYVFKKNQSLQRPFSTTLVPWHTRVSKWIWYGLHVNCMYNHIPFKFIYYMTFIYMFTDYTHTWHWYILGNNTYVHVQTTHITDDACILYTRDSCVRVSSLAAT